MKTTTECRLELIDNTGSDLTVVNAARVSFDKESDWDDGRVPQRDQKLINYLAKHGHWTPFAHNRYTFTDSVFLSESDQTIALSDPILSAGMVVAGDLVRHSLFGWSKLYNNGLVHDTVSAALSLACPVSWSALTDGDDVTKAAFIPPIEDGKTDPNLIDVTLRETVPIFVARQRFKHMIGFCYNEVSRRYVNDEPEFFVPNEWRGKPENAKQGSSEVIEGRAGECEHNLRMSLQRAKDAYEHLLDSGVCPEQARMVLPQSMMTSYYVTGSLAAWARAYKQRSDNHAQKEIQDLAKMWGEKIEPLYPKSWAALI